MKKTIALILVLFISIGCAVSQAETTINTVTLDYYSVNMNTNNGVIYGRKNSKASYALFDKNAEMLTTEAYIRMSGKEYGFVVTMEGTELANVGYIGTDGRQIVPCQYGEINEISDKWVAGIKFTESNSDNYDYKKSITGGETKYMLIDSVDFYYEGTLVGTLNRSAYKYTGTHGNYLYVQDREGNYTHYSPDFSVSSHSSASSMEYDVDYKNKVVYHSGSGAEAFTEGCVLTAEEVETALRVDKGSLIDLQGNVIADLSGYDSVYTFEQGYAKVKKDGKYGLINDKGDEVLSCIYDKLDDYKGFVCGYINAVKDGKQGFVSEQGKETGFVYPDNAVKVLPPFAYIQQLDGTIVVFSAAAGELPGRYTEYKNISGSAPYTVLMNAEGNVGVIGLGGETLIPFDGTYNKIYQLEVADDGKTILGNGKLLYLVDYDYAELEKLAAEALNRNALNAKWNCPVCGRENEHDFKFCPMDATARPEQKNGWQKIDGTWFYYDASGLLTDWQKIDDVWYFFDANGAMQTGWLKDGGNWYYLKNDGSMVSNTTMNIDGKSYTFNASGVMQ